MRSDVGEEVLEWATGMHRNAAELALMLGVSADRYTEDPLVLIPALQNYVDRLPLHEFEQSDWITLHTDLTAYLGDVLVRFRQATWKQVDDSTSPVGYRYFIEEMGIDGLLHSVEPFDVVLEEFQDLPVEICRMIANAESVLRVTSIPQE